MKLTKNSLFSLLTVFALFSCLLSLNIGKTQTKGDVEPVALRLVEIALDLGYADVPDIKAKKIGLDEIEVVENIDMHIRCIIARRSKTAKQIILIFRGTEPVCELKWWEKKKYSNFISDLFMNQESENVKKIVSKRCEGCKVHYGFIEAYLSVQNGVLNKVKKLLSSHKEIDQILISGHSLGGALATLCLADLNKNLSVKGVNKKDITYDIMTFGSPRVGNKEFANYINSLSRLDNNVRVVHGNDIVPQVPSNDGYTHIGTEINVNFDTKAGQLKAFNKDNTPKTLNPGKQSFLGFVASSCMSIDSIRPSKIIENISSIAEGVEHHTSYETLDGKKLAKTVAEYVEVKKSKKKKN